MGNPMNRLVYVLTAMGIMLGPLAPNAAAELYRYFDAEGKPHGVSELYLVPEEYREAAIADLERRKSESRGSLNIEEKASPSASADAAPKREASPAAPRAAAPQTSPAVDAGEIGGHDAFWWRSQAELRRKRLADLESELEAARKEEENWSSRIYRGGNGRAGKPGPGNSRNRGRAAILSAADDTDEPSVEELEQAVHDAQMDQNAFEDSARSAGVPPGWLRGS
jgi:hypothetical protein